MAFVKADLTLVNYSGNGFHIWHYTSNDASTVIDGSGYFNSAANEMNVGDVIFANTDVDGTPAYGIFVVNANSGTVVDTANMVSFSATDSD
jgi:hypothetical protein